MSFVPAIYLKDDVSYELAKTIEATKIGGFDGVIVPFNRDYKKYALEQSLSAAFHSQKKTSGRRITPRILCSHFKNFEALEDILKQAVAIKEQSGRIVVSLGDEDPNWVGKALKAVLRDFSAFKGKFLIELPMVDDEGNPWHAWHKLHSAVGFSSKVQVNLILTGNTPPTSSEFTRRWLGERIGMVTINPTSFVTEGERSHREFTWINDLRYVFQMLVQYTYCIVSIPFRDEIYNAIMRNFVKNSISKQIFMHEYKKQTDVLKYPLQPLTENLETVTYEIFEMDPVKYKLYQDAIVAAIKSRASDEDHSTMVVMVLGAGRGPLIRACVNASKITRQKLKIYAVEKNSNAVVTLSNLIAALWSNQDISLIDQDMRSLVLDVKADIIVSELMGSFGDNELSPECLQNARKILKPNGICIPSDSTAYLRPVMSKKIYDGIKQFESYPEFLKHFLSPLDMNWVVLIINAYYISNSQKLWKFSYPNDSSLNSRNKKLEFTSKADCILHGFAGYFEATLFENIKLSIVPENHTKGLFSWYSMFFAVRKPQFIEKGGKICVEFWRKYDDEKVWIEWSLDDGEVSNKDGYNYPIKL